MRKCFSDRKLKLSTGLPVLNRAFFLIGYENEEKDGNKKILIVAVALLAAGVAAWFLFFQSGQNPFSDLGVGPGAPGTPGGSVPVNAKAIYYEVINTLVPAIEGYELIGVDLFIAPPMGEYRLQQALAKYKVKAGYVKTGVTATTNVEIESLTQDGLRQFYATLSNYRDRQGKAPSNKTIQGITVFVKNNTYNGSTFEQEATEPTYKPFYDYEYEWIKNSTRYSIKTSPASETDSSPQLDELVGKIMSASKAKAPNYEFLGMKEYAPNASTNWSLTQVITTRGTPESTGSSSFPASAKAVMAMYAK